MNTIEPASHEPLSPELVLVLPLDVRAEVLASLGPPAWPEPSWSALGQPPESHRRDAARLTQTDEAIPGADRRFARTLGIVAATRVAQLAVIFLAVTLVTLALSVVAQAFR